MKYCKKLFIILTLSLLFVLTTIPVFADNISVHFIDVGQGDSTLIELPNGKNMLIDAGNNNDGKKIIKYIEDQNIDTIDFLIGTHPHADHIGGLDDIINHFKIKKIYMPEVIHTTKTFEDVLKAIKTKNLKITPAKNGLKIINNDKLNIKFLSPISSNYDNLNNWSAVLKIEYKNASFLFTGDAEEKVEKQLITNSIDLKSDIYKVSHHGSNSSNSRKFVKSISPQIAVISVGSDNNYGHPSPSVIKLLKSNTNTLLRTDIHGNIVITSNGNEYKIKNEKNDIIIETKSQSESENNNASVKITNVDKEKEKVTIKNTSDKKIDISGWKLLSVKGKQEFFFPDKTILEPDNIIKVVSGRNPLTGPDTIKWTGAYIWNNDEKDPAELYNKKGKLISTY